MKREVVMALSVAMASAMLFGCSGGGGAESAGEAVSTQLEEGVNATSETEEAPAQEEMSEPEESTIVIADEGQQEAADGEVDAESAVAVSDGSGESASLPPYKYPQPDPLMAGVCQGLIDEFSKHYDVSDVTIPVVRVVAKDETDPQDVKVWGDFWINNYNLEGDVLVTQSGGAYPGLVHARDKGDGAYEVTSIEVVADGSDSMESAKSIFGEHYEEFSRVEADHDDRESVRTQMIKDYVEANSLSVTAYQDFGWDPVSLK